MASENENLGWSTIMLLFGFTYAVTAWPMGGLYVGAGLVIMLVALIPLGIGFVKWQWPIIRIQIKWVQEDIDKRLEKMFKW